MEPPHKILVQMSEHFIRKGPLQVAPLFMKHSVNKLYFCVWLPYVWFLHCLCHIAHTVSGKCMHHSNRGASRQRICCNTSSTCYCGISTFDNVRLQLCLHIQFSMRCQWSSPKWGVSTCHMCCSSEYAMHLRVTMIVNSDKAMLSGWEFPAPIVALTVTWTVNVTGTVTMHAVFSCSDSEIDNA